MIMYHPVPKLFVNLMYLPLATINANVRYLATDALSFYEAFQSQSESYFLNHRVDLNERFYAYDQRLTLGTRRMLGRHWALDASAAYVFNRSYYLAQSFTAHRLDSVNVENGLAASIRLDFFPWAR